MLSRTKSRKDSKFAGGTVFLGIYSTFGDVGDERCLILRDVGDNMCLLFGAVGDKMCLFFREHTTQLFPGIYSTLGDVDDER